MTGTFTHPVARYAVAVVATSVATFLRWPLNPFLGERVPFGHHLLVVLLVTWVAGSGPGFLSLALGLLATALFVMLPHGELFDDVPADYFGLVVYAIVGCVAILLFRHTRVQHRLAEERSAENLDLAARLREADRRKDEFLALLAHELRNPIAPIRTGLDLLDRAPDSGIAVQTRDVIRRQVEQLVRIVDDLLDVSRFVRGKVRLRSEVLDLRDVVDLALETMRPVLDDRRHELRYRRPIAPLCVRGDRLRLVQVVTNLLGNAAKYTPREGRVGIRVEDRGDEVEIHVSDNGIGIPRHSQASIFELFAQANASPTRDHGGLGLGLAIVHGLTELHGGRVSVHSDGPGRGSTFSIALPRVPAGELVGPTPRAVVPVTDRIVPVTDETAPPTVGFGSIGDTVVFGEPGRSRRLRVLVVDDNLDAAKTLAALITLEDPGVYATRVVGDGPAALASIERFRPDIVLLDIGLPGMDGYEVARRIVEQCGDERPRLVAVTGWGGAEDRRRTAEAGFDHHMVKPVATEVLLAQLVPRSRPRANGAEAGREAEFA